ncbi:hypothetical protein QYF36_021412 [Acer negundo]|nr:hypothetical protein QYF36_021412 [Acer negundo]
MGSAEIEKLCALMSLREQEGLVRKLHDALKVAGAHKMTFYLARKILSPDLVNRKAFRSLIARIWRLRAAVKIEVITSNIYAFHFQLHDDNRKVLARGTWSFDDSLIVLKEPTGKGVITESIIGEVREVDSGPSGDCLGKFLRVRVEVKINKPLRRFLQVDVLGDGEETVMPIQYERLPIFCFHCRLIGHSLRGCPVFGKDGSTLDSSLQYGAWLRVSDLPKQT